jgi:N utilization substance protein B
VAEHSAELDEYIAKYAKNWRFERISRVAAAIMRTAMFEVLYMPEVPYKAAINEAVELAKKYESREVVSFITASWGFCRGRG